ncbi:permease [Nostoc sp. UHCC 0251]|uniref:permease n=1 Tax=Nostoc sp. UHCC 0251 TaxID=3110240 RepID=UPI002B1F1557|nr:permease [Nostoc sp. UHCC 0251]MEA5626785.1 permease [Nostoc sp. UHCC 0251]
MLNQIGEALLTSAGILWKSFWALMFGYIVSAAIQVIVTRSQMARVLGKRGWKQAILAGVFGFISSSCSFAAIAASRSVFVKGAHPVNSLSFLIASTNLVIELGIVLWVLLGWKFFVGNFLLGILMIFYAYILTRFWFPRELANEAKQHAQQRQEGEGMHHHTQMQNKNWWQKLTSKEGWRAISHAFFMEWKMAYKEILFGFTIAGFISVFIPTSFWNTLFLQSGQDAPSLFAILENALVAPVIAFFTFIGSMGNVPLAALLWSKNASFAGVMSFLGADLVAATVVYLQAKYYGWKYAVYLSGLLYICMVAAGITVHGIFALFNVIPTQRTALTELVRFAIDYTFWLNIIFAVIGGILLWMHFKDNDSEYHQQHREEHSQQETAN